LRYSFNKLSDTRKAALELGACRHATVMMSTRTIAVCQRKIELLIKLEKNCCAFTEACQQKNAIVEYVVGGADAAEVVGPAAGMRERLREFVHAGDRGRPELADRTDFERFAATFGLPAHHVDVLSARQMFKTECDAWSQLILERCHAEVDQEAAGDTSPEGQAAAMANRLAQLLTAITSCGPEDARIETLHELRTKARASACSRNAEWEAEEDLKQAQVKEKGDAANRAAERIEANVKKATVDYRIEKRHPLLMLAVRVAKDLRAEGLLRYAVDELRRTKGEPGDDERAANHIERACKRTIAAGVPATNAKVEQCRSMALEAREQEGLRKRQANAEKLKAAPKKEK